MNERLIAYHILTHFENKGTRLDDLVQQQFINKSLNSHHKRYIKNVTSGVLRFRCQLDFFIKKLYHGKFSKILIKVKTILRLALYEMLFLENIPVYSSVNEYVKLAKKQINPKTGALINAILRGFIRNKSELQNSYTSDSNRSEKLNFPAWLLDRWQNVWGEEFTYQLCMAFNHIPEFDIRVNNHRIDKEDFENLLRAQNINFEKGRLEGFYKISQMSIFIEAGFLEKGLCTVQDESASIPVKLLDLKSQDTFLDTCSAPGGKFTQAIEKCPDIQLAVALDDNLDRLKKVKQNLNRLDLHGYLVAADARHLPFKKKFTKILIDAPCSGQGVIGKHPDLKWRRKESEINEFTALQSEILKNVSEYVDNHGTIVYSTCSIDPYENETVIATFLKSHSHFKKKDMPVLDGKNFLGSVRDGYIRTFPHLDKTDGSVVCILKKKI